jgi:hypothetical protein
VDRLDFGSGSMLFDHPMIAARGPLPAHGALLDIQSWCFRREPSKVAPRRQIFRMHEIVCLGSAVNVRADFYAG